MFSEASKTLSDAHSDTQQYNNEPNFVTLRNIPEQEKIKIIQLGFQLNQEGKISLKKYYEDIGKYSLFQWKGYSIKYESIRRTKFYQQLKEKSFLK